MPTITNDTIYTTEYCTNYTGGVCVETTTIYGFGKEELKQAGVEILTTVSIFICVILLLVWFVKGIFRLIMPNKGKRI